MDPNSVTDPNIYALDKRLSLLEAAFSQQAQKLGDISSNLQRLVWIVLSAVVVGVLTQLKGS